jgi:Fic family protein
MFPFKITETIAADLARFEELRVRLDSGAFLARTWSGRLRRELESEAIGASVSMEGVPVTVDEVRRILAGDRPSAVSIDDAALVLGYQDAMRAVLRRADDPAFEWQTEVLRNVHERVLAGSYVAGAGRYRESQVFVTRRESGRVVYTPPAPELVPGLVGELTAWLGGSKADGAPSPVTAALAHVSLAAIHPFRDGNGRTARILASLVMYRGGYRQPQFTSLEEWWGSHQADYYAAFDCLGETWDPTADVTPFIAAHVRAQTCQAEALSLRLSTERLLWQVLEEVAKSVRTDERAANALFDAIMLRDVTNRYYRSVVDVTAPTAAKDLTLLESARLLVSRGRGRSTSYSGTVALAERVAQVAGIGLDTRGAERLDERLRDGLMVALAERAHRRE